MQRLRPGCGTRSREEEEEGEDWQSIQAELKRPAVLGGRGGGGFLAPLARGRKKKELERRRVGRDDEGGLMRTGGGGFPKQLAAISTDPIKINGTERGLCESKRHSLCAAQRRSVLRSPPPRRCAPLLRPIPLLCRGSATQVPSTESW